MTLMQMYLMKDKGEGADTEYGAEGQNFTATDFSF